MFIFRARTKTFAFTESAQGTLNPDLGDFPSMIQSYVIFYVHIASCASFYHLSAELRVFLNWHYMHFRVCREKSEQHQWILHDCSNPSKNENDKNQT